MWRTCVDWTRGVWAMVRLKAHQRRVRKSVPLNDPGLEFCYAKLQKVSRSFAVVIMALDHQVRDAVCIFYLVLRALDTVEDDMAIPLDVKVPELLSFHEKLSVCGWNIRGIGQGHERDLLERFDVVIQAYLGLPGHLQEPIADICRRMGEGMAASVQRAAEEVVDTVTEYERYCHYAAGLVGHGLSRIFAASGLEPASLATQLDTANSMGLFLQKVSILRGRTPTHTQTHAPQPHPYRHPPRRVPSGHPMTRKRRYVHLSTKTSQETDARFIKRSNLKEQHHQES